MSTSFKWLFTSAAFTLSSLASANAVTTDLGSTLSFAAPGGSGRSAIVQISQGQATFDLSNGSGVYGELPNRTAVGGMVGTLNVLQAQLTAVDGATIEEVDVPIGKYGYPVRGGIRITAEPTSLTVDDETGQIRTINSTGGTQHDVLYNSGIVDGGQVTIKNLAFDLSNKTVYADLHGRTMQVDDTLGAEFASLHTPMWTISSIDGPTALPPAAWLAASNGDFSSMQQLGYTLLSTSGPDGDPTRPLYAIGATTMLRGLKVTDQGFDFLTTALGLTPGSTGYATLAGANQQTDGWGTIKSTMTLAPAAIPEPGTHALMGLGLVGIGLATRRTAVKCCRS